ncbi:hypothetical protein [Streptomyces dubilierae]|uniref:Uncharacterized protein n=1 Tax=Streptomyces dubilierae TaxID=3075533 RepID=A0ABU2P572_9ACTN|nr:hypothetical protein [Streptomyces sp. DSM 41921]MDT0387298.1 hypothetical protein [Streptomyces sp. DSM 41921]
MLREAELEVLLAAVLIHDGIDAEAEQRAVAAFRAARRAGARARTRRRDDWRPRERRLPGRSLKATLSVLLASLTLGGVAVAAIGSVASTDEPGERGQPPVSTPAPGPSAGGVTEDPAGSGSARPDHPGTAGDVEAHCRAYERVGGRGKALGATAWQRLVEAAGGETKVTAYCAEQEARAEEQTDGTTAPGKGEGTPGAGTPGAGNAGAGRGGSANAGDGPGGDGRGTGSQEGDPGAANSGSGGNGSGARDGAEDTTGNGSSGGQGKPAQPNDRRP